jgi:hypothetical protein
MSPQRWHEVPRRQECCSDRTLQGRHRVPAAASCSIRGRMLLALMSAARDSAGEQRGMVAGKARPHSYSRSGKLFCARKFGMDRCPRLGARKPGCCSNTSDWGCSWPPRLTRASHICLGQGSVNIVEAADGFAGATKYCLVRPPPNRSQAVSRTGGASWKPSSLLGW